MTIEGLYDPERKPWVIQLWEETSFGTFVLRETFTPESPGPLTGTWEFSELVNGECDHGQLGLDTDPNWKPDTFVMLIWEQPNTALPPDFLGTVGLIRGKTEPLGGDYTLPLLGLLDVDAQGVAGAYSSFTFGGLNVGGGIQLQGISGLGPLPTETVSAHHSRMLEPYPDGSSGVRGDGVRVIGLATSNFVTIAATGEDSPVYDLSLSGYERQKYVTETSQSPGERYALLTQTRSRPSSLTPRVYQGASGNAPLINPDQSSVPATSWLALDGGSFTLGSSQTFTASVNGPEETSESRFGDQDAGVTRTYGLSFPISQLVRQSAHSDTAAGTDYDLTSLKVNVEYAQTLSSPGIVSFDEFAYYDEAQIMPEYTTITAEHWISATATGFDETDAISPGESAVRTLTRQDDPRASIQLEPPPDIMQTVYISLNGGLYYWKVSVTVRHYFNDWRFTKKDPPPNILSGSDGYYDPDTLPKYRRTVFGEYDASLSISATQTADRSVGSIPTGNLPDGWSSDTLSPPTAQFSVSGRLRGPAKLTGIPLPDSTTLEQVITQYRRVRGLDTYHTECQTGARQTRILTAAEANLEAAQRRRLLTALGGGVL